MSADQAGINEDKTRKGIADLLEGADLEKVSLYKFRRELARHLELGKKGLDHKATDLNQLDQGSSRGKSPDGPRNSSSASSGGAARARRRKQCRQASSAPSHVLKDLT